MGPERTSGVSAGTFAASAARVLLALCAVVAGAGCGRDSRSTRDLLVALGTSDEEALRKAKEELNRRWPESGPELLAALTDTDEEVQVAAGDFLMRNDIRPIAAELRTLRGRAEGAGRFWGTLLLVPLEPPSAEAAATLAQALEGKSVGQRNAALVALAWTYPPSHVPAVPALLEALKTALRYESKAWPPRGAGEQPLDGSIAEDALLRFAPSVTVPIFVETLGDAKPNWWAINALGRMGPAAAAAIPALEKVASAPKPDGEEARSTSSEGEAILYWSQATAKAREALQKIRGH